MVLIYKLKEDIEQLKREVEFDEEAIKCHRRSIIGNKKMIGEIEAVLVLLEGDE